MSISVDFQNRFIELVDYLDNKNKTSVAEQMGVTYVIFSKAYNYGIVPKPLVLMRMADFLEVSVTYLLGKTDSLYFDKARNPTTFHKRLEMLMKKEKLKPGTLAGRVHVHRNSVLQWIKSEYYPSIDDLVTMADIFDVSLDYLLGRTDDDTPYKD